MAVSRVKWYFSKEPYYSHILYHLVDIYGDKMYEIVGYKKKVLGYGIQQYEFSKIKDTAYPITERMFREYKDGLIKWGYIKEVYARRKDKRPRYMITPLGVAYLVQNMEISKNGLSKCVKVIMQYYKGDKKGLNFKKLGPYIHTFKEACDLFRFDKYQITIQTKILPGIGQVDIVFPGERSPDTKVDMRFIPYTFHPKGLEKNFETVSDYLISNMCWLLVSVAIPALQVLEPKEKKELEFEEMFDSLTPQIIKLAKTFGQKVSKHLESQNNLVKLVLAH